MKAITIKQPWASLIVAGIKDIENRTWPTKYRGTVLIHAGASFAFKYLVDGLNADQLQVIRESNITTYPKVLIDNVVLDYPVSAIIGKVDIVGCVIEHPSVWAEIGFPWVDKPIYNWVLANPVQFDEPILNVKGKLSFWEWEGKA